MTDTQFAMAMIAGATLLLLSFIPVWVRWVRSDIDLLDTVERIGK